MTKRPQTGEAQTGKACRGGIISGLLTFFAILVLLAVAGSVYLAHNVRVQTTHRHGGDSVAIDVPGGHINIRAHENMDPTAIGVPVYPGATRRRDNNGGASFQWTSSDGRDEKGVSVAAGEYVTSDPADKVLSWYRAQLPNWLIVTGEDGVEHLELREGGYKRIVAIKRKFDGTHIAVASVGDPASN
ncbi:MAG TPA: hypothetical protein VNH18_12325 [Bryobacteraceae bacterium]|nr:hypothetical protein [Bryobacteraceae bacterium]